MKLADVIVIILYLLVIALVGILGARKAKTSEDYIVAGRNLNFFMYFGCLAALILGGAATVGTAKMGYESGYAGIWYVTCQGIALALIGIFLAKKISKLKVLTIGEMLGNRYGAEARLISSIVSAIYTVMLTVTQIIAIGSVLNVWIGWDFTVSAIVAGGIVLFYTILGGMWSVTLTDIIQFIIMTVGIFFIMLPLSLHEVGGLSGFVDSVPKEYFHVTQDGGINILKSLLLYTLGIMIGQDVWQRFFTARTVKVSKLGAYAAFGYAFLYAIVVVTIGMCAFIVVPNLDNAQNAFAGIAVEILPAGILGLVLAAVLSALMSTASGTLIASSTLIVNDIIKCFIKPEMSEKQFLRVSRITTTIIGIFSMICALWIQDVLVALDIAFAFLSGALFFPIIFYFFWKRVTAKAVFYSILVSSVAIAIGFFTDGITSIAPIIYGLIASFITITLITLLSKQTNEVSLNQTQQPEEIRK